MLYTIFPQSYIKTNGYETKVSVIILQCSQVLAKRRQSAEMIREKVLRKMVSTVITLFQTKTDSVIRNKCMCTVKEVA
jgi:hypothetical protein